MNDTYSDPNNIILTSEQWAETANQYKVIDQGVLCIEIKSPSLMLIKVGVGDKYYKDLPYIHGGDGTDIDISAYAKIEYVDNKFDLCANKEYVNSTIKSITFDINELKKIAHTHENKDILDTTTASFTIEEKHKLAHIDDNADKYNLPVATDDTLGGIKVGGTLLISDDGLLNIDLNKIPGSSIMYGATDDEDGKSGAVPVPLKGDNNKYLKGDGTWAIPDGIEYEVFTGAVYGYDDIDEDTGEEYHVSGAGTTGLVPSPPERNYDLEYQYGDMYLRYDGEWAYIPQIETFTASTMINPGKKGLVPAPQIGDFSKFLCSDGSWRDVGDNGFQASYLYDGFTSDFRIQIVPRLPQGDFIKLIQSTIDDITFAPIDGAGIAYGVGDKNAYIYINDNDIMPEFFIGGGSGNNLNWIRQVSFTDHTHPIDDELSTESTNPVQNKVITNEIDIINQKIDEIGKIKFDSKSDFPIIGDVDILYIATDEDKIYRWDDGIAKYVLLSSNIDIPISYGDLSDLPTLNGIQIIGDKTNEEYGICELTNEDIEGLLD